LVEHGTVSITSTSLTDEELGLKFPVGQLDHDHDHDHDDEREREGEAEKQEHEKEVI